MSDETKEPGKLDSEGKELEPKPNFSQKDPETSPGEADKQLDALIEQLTPRLEAIVLKAAQSEKDKGIASAKKDASEALGVATAMRSTVDKFKGYVARYGSEEAAYAEMERDARIEEALGGKSTQDKGTVGADAKDWEVSQKEILTSVGIESSDERVREFIKSQDWSDKSPTDYIAALRAESFKWMVSNTDKPKPDASSIGTDVKGTTSSPNLKGETETLAAEMLSLQADYTKNETRILEIDAELKRRDKEEK